MIKGQPRPGEPGPLVRSELPLASFLWAKALLVLVKALRAIDAYELSLSLRETVTVHEEVLGPSLAHGGSQERSMIKHALLWPSVGLSEAAGTECLLLIVECDVSVEELLVDRSGLEEPSTGSATRLRPLLVK